MILSCGVKSGFSSRSANRGAALPLLRHRNLRVFFPECAIVFKKPPNDEYHIEDVKQVNSQWRVAGTSGVILIVVGLGQTMKQAQSQVYSRIKNVMITNMCYRTDIGDRWDEDSDRLRNWGI
jgi:phosphoribosylamine--glycine ligase